MAANRAGHREGFFLAAAACVLFLFFGGGYARGAQSDESTQGERLIHKGVIVDFQVRPADRGESRGLAAGQMAEVRFTLTEEHTGKPVRGISPGVWMDIGEAVRGRTGDPQKSCKDKIALYLKGAVGIRPLIDLNGYFVLVLNREPSISVVDPLVSMVGVTSTLGTIPLNGPGADWARSADQKRLYVSIPKTGEVAVVDTDAFKVEATLQAGPDPIRVTLQPDGRYLWVGNDARSADRSGVTLIDVETLKPVASLSTGAGHHEIAFTADSRYAFVSNREAGTVTVIDIVGKKKVRDVATGPVPIALAYSPLARALYVADAKEGIVSVLDGTSHEVTARIEAKPGLGPMRFTPDGRFGMTVNPSGNAVYIFDAAENALIHTVAVSGKPYQVVMSRAFAYVRSLDSERVTMINLATLGKGKDPIVQGFAAGSVPPKGAGDLSIADSVAPASVEAAVMVVNPADSTTYFYMEGMNAPSSNYKVYGARSMAVMVIDRNLKEVKPGVYASKVKIPAAGRYDVAFLLETPQILHCFSMEAKADPRVKINPLALEVEYSTESRMARIGEVFPLRFTLRDPATGKPRTGIADVRVMYFLAPGRNRREVRAEEIGEGVYRALLPVDRPGAYYVRVAVPSMKVGYTDLTAFTMMATQESPPPASKPPSDRKH